jgi:ferredoxin
MNINGKNGLACLTNMNSLGRHRARPLPGLPVIRDLIVDMTQFFKQYHSIKPYLINDRLAQRSAAVARRARRAQRPVRVHPVRLLLHQLPVVLVEPGQVRRPGRSAAGLPLHRGQPRPATSERLDNLEDPYRLFRCHTIMNCVDVCPKGLNPTKPSARSRTDGSSRRLMLMTNTLLDERERDLLRWRSRRGLVENDLFIEQFFATYGSQLTRRRDGLSADGSGRQRPDGSFLASQEPEGQLDTQEVREVLEMVRKRQPGSCPSRLGKLEKEVWK